MRSRTRVALYSHDAQGLGHLRRNLAIAGALAGSPLRPDILLLTGAAEAGAFARPRGCDVVSLPALAKGADGSYGARHLSASLTELMDLRSSVLFAALTGFAPDLLVVDKHPRGAFGELETALDMLRVRGGTRTVLGLRDVLDDPARSAQEWAAAGGREALAQWYDGVWVYGDPRVHDPLADLDLPALPAGATHTGYLGRGAPVRVVDSTGPGAGSPYALCLVGGGSDGARLAAAFAAAPLPRGMRGILVLGPHMPAADRARVRTLAVTHRQVEVHDLCTDVESLLDGASAVVAMGGYNTVCEVLARRVPLLVVPRVRPRTEQLVRAERMAALGLLDVLHPDRLDPAALACWVTRRRTRGGSAAAPDVDLDGLRRIPRLAANIVTGLGTGLGTVRQAGSRQAPACAGRPLALLPAVPAAAARPEETHVVAV